MVHRASRRQAQRPTVRLPYHTGDAESLNMGFPKVSAERQKELRAMRNELAAE